MEVVELEESTPPEDFEDALAMLDVDLAGLTYPYTDERYTSFFAEGSNLNWRGQSGDGFFSAESAEEFYRVIVGNRVGWRAKFEVGTHLASDRDEGHEVHVKVWSHDCPGGAFYRILPAVMCFRCAEIVQLGQTYKVYSDEHQYADDTSYMCGQCRFRPKCPICGSDELDFEDGDICPECQDNRVVCYGMEMAPYGHVGPVPEQPPDYIECRVYLTEEKAHEWAEMEPSTGEQTWMKKTGEEALKYWEEIRGSNMPSLRKPRAALRQSRKQDA